jgi:hypothetical protein
MFRMRKRIGRGEKSKVVINKWYKKKYLTFSHPIQRQENESA